MIFSHYAHFDRRRACRSTWLTGVKNHENLLGYKFFLTTPEDSELIHVKSEQNLFSDTIVSNRTKKLGNNLKAFYLWMWEVIVWIKIQSIIFDYYVLVHDDSYVCVEHFLHDSNYWPKDVYLSHMRFCISDVVMIIGQTLMSTGYEVFYSGKLRSPQLWDEVLKYYSPLTIRINEIRLFYGARGPKYARYNDWKNGWVGGDLCSVKEKNNFCEIALSAHQAYPNIMYDLWANDSAAAKNFPQPTLSKNCFNLDNVIGYNN